MQQREPIFNVPGTVVAVLAVMVGIHAARQLLSTEQDAWVVLCLAFIPARYAGHAADLPGGEVAAVTSFITHMAVHGDLTHLVFNGAWLLAFGGAIALRCGGGRFLAFALTTGVAGALAFLLVNPGLLAPVIGASGAVAGLMGGTMRFLFNALDLGGVAQLRDNARHVPLMTLADCLRDRRMQLSTALFVLFNALALFGLGTGGAQGGIAWEAHIGGYVAGLLSYGFFDRRQAAPPGRPATLH